MCMCRGYVELNVNIIQEEKEEGGKKITEEGGGKQRRGEGLDS